MRPRTIRIVDVGMTTDFTASSSFLDALVSTLTVQAGERPLAIPELVRSEHTGLLLAALQEPADVIHLVAHGSTDAAEVTIGSDRTDKEWRLRDLAGLLQDTRKPIAAPCVFIDACDSTHSDFQRQVRDCISRDTTYIGCSAANTWFDSTTFSAALYPALLRNKGRGVDFGLRAAESAKSAMAAFEVLLHRRCPFNAKVLTPSRVAKRVFT